jgi:hypothetical protein
LTSDYYSFGERVLAAADGKVVKVDNSSIQERSRLGPTKGRTREHFRENASYRKCGKIPYVTLSNGSLETKSLNTLEWNIRRVFI